MNNREIGQILLKTGDECPETAASGVGDLAKKRGGTFAKIRACEYSADEKVLFSRAKNAEIRICFATDVLGKISCGKHVIREDQSFFGYWMAEDHISKIPRGKHKPCTERVTGCSVLIGSKGFSKKLSKKSITDSV